MSAAIGEPGDIAGAGSSIPVRGSHAWVGMLLVLASSAVSIGGLCWMAGQAARLLG